MYTLDQQLALEEKYKSYAEELIKNHLYVQREKGRTANTVIGKGIVKSLVDTFCKNVEKWLVEEMEPKRGVQKVYKKLLDTILEKTDIKQVVLTMCTFTFEEVVNKAFHNERTSMSSLGDSIARKVYIEIQLEEFIKNNKYKVNAIQDGLNKRVQTKNKYAYVRQIFDTHYTGIYKPNNKEYTALGCTLVNIFVNSSTLFEYSNQGTKSISVRPTQDMLALWTETERKLITHAQQAIPTIIPPKEWTDLRDGAYYGIMNGASSLIRFKGFLKKTRLQKKLERKIQEVDLSEIKTAIKKISNTPYRINKRILEVVNAIMANGGDQAGIPRLEPLEDLPKLTGEYTPEQLKAHKQKKVELIQKEIERKSKALRAIKTIDTANDFAKYDVMYFPCNMDFRGRIYPIPTFNHQGDDLMKGLIEYVEPVPANHEDCLGILKVQGANLIGNDKISLHERQEYIDSITPEILASASDPFNCNFWQQADEPLQFLAWCFEYKSCVEYMEANNGSIIGFECRVPIAFDGTCSGLQHYSAMLHDEVGGSSVNLIDHERPADIYNDVAKIVLELVKKDTISGTLDVTEEDHTTFGTKALAQAWLNYGVTRKVCKRPVMTLAYGSGKYGFAEQLYEDITKKAVEFSGGLAKPASRYLAKYIWEAVQNVVVSATEGMEFLKAIASEFIKDNVPVHWWTPLGLPVQQQYIKTTIKSFRTRFGASMSMPLYYTEVDPDEKVNKIEQKNGIAPNFIHSLDSTHLMMTVLNSNLRNYTTIHDSFGTSLGEAMELQQVTREQLYRLYTEYKPLETFKAYAENILGRQIDIPIPKLGNLDLKEILKSKYVFH